jgi:glycosyltransferase involved in cell wall biosynthesis
MKEAYTVAWSFRNRKNVLFESIRTADKTCPKSVDFCLVDAASDEDTIRSLREYCNGFKDRRIRICESSYRSSLSEAWNLCMMLTENRFVIYASSDVVFIKEGWFETIQQLTSTHQYILLNNHAVFCLDKKAIPKMGWFDEQFVAGPHFDPDLMIRASEHNISMVNAGNNGFFIHGDEADKEVAGNRYKKEVKDRLPMNNYHNEEYFKRKWASNWPGWKDAIDRGEVHLPHPPVNISQAQRLIVEVDPHPAYTAKYK